MQKFKKIKQSFMLASLMMASAWCEANNLGAADYVIPKMDMCYYLDSYLGLGIKYLADNPSSQYDNECIGAWVIVSDDQVIYPDYSTTYYHKLKVIYCCTGVHGSIQG